MEQDIQNDGDGMTNHEIIEKAKKLRLKNFKYFMSDELVGKTPDIKECGIVNLDDSTGEGTHHICYWINNRIKYCFDSFGVAPPTELVDYLKKLNKRKITYSTYIIQDLGDTNCSELCLYLLDRLNKGDNYREIVLECLKKNS